MQNILEKEPIRLIVADDHAVVRAGFISVLRSHPGIAVVGSAQSGGDLLNFLASNRVDVLLLDLHMPGMTNTEILLALQKNLYGPKVIVLSSFEPDEEICRAIEAGAKGYLRKDTSCNEIIDAVRTVYSGHRFLPQRIMDQISERKLRPNLSPREHEILELVSKGLTNKEIGHVIQVSHFTVRNHVRHIIAKLDVGDRTEAATFAFQQGILTARDAFQSDECAGESQASRPLRPLLFERALPNIGISSHVVGQRSGLRV